MEKKLILVVDDERDLGETIKMMLEVMGEYRVEAAYDGKEGVKKAHILKPDLIIMDIKMPEMDGLEALKLLKESDDTMAIPVVMLTTCDDDIFKMRACQLYDEDYLIKPVKREELLDRIDKIVRRRAK